MPQNNVRLFSPDGYKTDPTTTKLGSLFEQSNGTILNGDNNNDGGAGDGEDGYFNGQGTSNNYNYETIEDGNGFGEQQPNTPWSEMQTFGALF